MKTTPFNMVARSSIKFSMKDHKSQLRLTQNLINPQAGDFMVSAGGQETHLLQWKI